MASATGLTLLVAVLSTAFTIITTPPALADASVVIADWQMNEPVGARVMTDASGNNINGTIGSAVRTGFVLNGATGYQWTSVNPTAPPPKPERLVQVNDSRLNPGNRDYAVTVRFRTTHSYGNMIQKGQSTTPGGYFKWQIPSGRLNCLYRSRDQAGNLIGHVAINSPANMPLNDGAWHTVRCERRVDRVIMTIDGTTTVQKLGRTGPISNNYPLTIGGKLNCDQVSVTCDYFAGEIDWVRIEAGSSGSTDTTPPTTPGTPTGVSSSAGRIDLTWTGSTDASLPITYRVYRDGGTTPIGQTTTTSFADIGLAPGSTHTYAVDAVDAANNASAKSPVSNPITVMTSPSAIFADDFSSGTFANWTGVTRLSIDGTQGSAAAPSARGNPVAQSAFAYRSLGATYQTACLSARVNASSLGGNAVDLLRLRTAADGPIARAYVNASGTLFLRADFSGAQRSSGVALGSGWHQLELCGTVGSAGAWDLYRDGVRIVSGWTANTGTTPVGRIQIGDTAAKTWTANFDDVAFDLAAG
jgi:hypothetical protein